MVTRTGEQEIGAVSGRVGVYDTDDVTLPLSLQNFILGICTIQKLTFWTTNPFRKTSLLAFTPLENLTSNPFRKAHI